MTIAQLDVDDVAYLLMNQGDLFAKGDDNSLKPRVKIAVVEGVSEEFGAKEFTFCTPWKESEHPEGRKKSVEKRNIAVIATNSAGGFPHVMCEDPAKVLQTFAKLIPIIESGNIESLATLEDAPINGATKPFSPLRNGLKVVELSPGTGQWKQWTILEIKRPLITLGNRKERVVINHYGQEVRDGKTYFKRFFMHSLAHYQRVLMKPYRWNTEVTINAN